MTEEEKSDALNEKWYNYCVSESFEPGSTFKPIVVASALEMGAITTDATTSVTVENLSPIQKSNVIIFTVMEMRR